MGVLKGMAMGIMAVIAFAAMPEIGQGAGEPGRLMAGAAKVDITPAAEDAVDLVGNKMKLVDPLYARVLVLKTEETSLAIVSLDLILFSSAKVVAEAKETWGVEHVILSSTHTHSAMAPEGLRLTPGAGGGTRRDWTRAGNPEDFVDWPSLSEDPWYAATEEKIVAAIGEATQSLFPARIVSKRQPYENPYMASNRRYVTPDGKGHNRWGNASRVPTEPRDPNISVIRVDDEAGKPRVLLVHYSCHPVLLMNAGLLARDYPGPMVDQIEQELGGDCMAMFLQGAQGDQDPYDLHRFKGEDLTNAVQQSGITLAQEALRVSKTLPTPDKDEASLKIKETMVPIAYRDGKGSTEACITAVMINKDLALVTIPGEPLVQHQLDLAAKSPVRDTLMMGLAYSGQGAPFLVYIPTEQAAKEGGYSGTECVFVEGAAGKNMVNAALAQIQTFVKD